MLVGLLVSSASFAQNWANWRGPNYNGSTDGKNLPVKFSPKENVKWSVELPGPSAATPIIWDDRVFVSSTDTKAQALVGLCFDRNTGALRWRQVVGTGYRSGGEGTALQLDSMSNYASPSPVTDGKRVYFFFGNGDLACFDMDGRKIWQRNIQKDYGDFAFQWTFGSSPQLFGGKLYMQILQRNQAVGNRGKDGADSFLLALNPETGKELWRRSRPTPARMESREAYSTPIPFRHNGRTELLITGGDMVSGHDPATGKELWRWGTWNEAHREVWWRLVPSPVAGGGVVLACAPKRMPVYAAKCGGNGDLGPAGLAWKSEDRSALTSDVPTPLFYRGKFYILSDVKKALSCVDPANGNILWSIPTPSTEMCWTSPTGADGKIYFMSLKGEVYVVDAANGKLLATNVMAEDEKGLSASMPVAHGDLYVRTATRLYCIGAKTKSAPSKK
jgi:outer membrane protein assembly factor BamB